MWVLELLEQAVCSLLLVASFFWVLLTLYIKKSEAGNHE